MTIQTRRWDTRCSLAPGLVFRARVRGCGNLPHSAPISGALASYKLGGPLTVVARRFSVSFAALRIHETSSVGLCGTSVGNPVIGVSPPFGAVLAPPRSPPRPPPRFARLLRWTWGLGEMAPFSGGSEGRADIWKWTSRIACKLEGGFEKNFPSDGNAPFSTKSFR